MDALVQALKYGGQLVVARFLAGAMASLVDEPIDVLVPMPLSEARMRERGFNQAHEIARHVGRMSGIEAAPALCRRVRETPPQAALPWKARAGNVRGAFVCATDVSGLRIAVIDDVATTGATLNEVSRVLKQAGAARVIGWCASRALRVASAGIQ